MEDAGIRPLNGMFCDISHLQQKAGGAEYAPVIEGVCKQMLVCCNIFHWTRISL